MHPCEEKVGGDGNCPVGVPPVTSMSQGEATALLTSAGFGVTAVEVTTSDQTLNGIVKSYSPDGLQDHETVITIEVWKWDGTTP